jgi:hypothetical protein
MVNTPLKICTTPLICTLCVPPARLNLEAPGPTQTKDSNWNCLTQDVTALQPYNADAVGLGGGPAQTDKAHYNQGAHAATAPISDGSLTNKLQHPHSLIHSQAGLCHEHVPSVAIAAKHLGCHGKTANPCNTLVPQTCPTPTDAPHTSTAC